jgi:hypothetical protein
VLKTIVKLGVVLLIAHALYRFVPVYVHYQQFKDAVRETALFSKDKSAADLTERVMELAAKYRIPLERESVQVRREGEDTVIEASYVETIEWLPSYRRPWQFDASARAWNARPTKAGDLIR